MAGLVALAIAAVLVCAAVVFVVLSISRDMGKI
jgi:hypothetical protein